MIIQAIFRLLHRRLERLLLVRLGLAYDVFNLQGALFGLDIVDSLLLLRFQLLFLVLEEFFDHLTKHLLLGVVLCFLLV